MSELVNEQARIVAHEQVGPKLHVIELEASHIATNVKPGQFVHMKVPGRRESVLRRPFSVYARNASAHTIEILYQEVGSITSYLPSIASDFVELIGPIGNTWSQRAQHALLVGGGVGAAPLFMLAQSLSQSGIAFDVVLGAQTESALVTLDRYRNLTGCAVHCATDDGSFGRAGFCTSLVEERLDSGCSLDGKPYDYMAVCGPEPLMKIASDMGLSSGIATELSMEKRMACGIGACLSCVVDTTHGKKRSCVDGPIFNAQEVVW